MNTPWAAVLGIVLSCSSAAAQVRTGAEAALVIRGEPSALLAIDQHRTAVVDRIVTEWGDKLFVSGAGVTREQLREMLFAMRADQLLAASLAGSLNGVRDALANALSPSGTAKPRAITTKALGDSADDVVYTPMTPCRLVETRPGTFAAVYQGAGAFAASEIRNYTIQGGNGVCLQLPIGLNLIAVQLQVFGIPVNGASGDIEILPQGSTFGSTATEVFLGTELITSASTTVKINLATNQIGVQVRGGGANVAIDVVGYFKAPSGPGNYFVQGGNAFASPAQLGTLDNQPLALIVNGQPTLRLSAAADANNNSSTNVVNGLSGNGFNAGVIGATISGGGLKLSNNSLAPNHVSGSFGTIAGGNGNTAADEATVGGGGFNTASGNSSTVAGGGNNTASDNFATVAGGSQNHASGPGSTIAGGAGNTASGSSSTVPGGLQNIASGIGSLAAGVSSNATQDNTFVWGDGSQAANSTGPKTFSVLATGGIGFYPGFQSVGIAWAGWSCVVNSGSANWSCASDRNLKENFAALDEHDVLDRLERMPVTSWNFKGYPNRPHIGPVAQDFHAQFRVGDPGDDKNIDIGDEVGVALAAIQGLHQLVQEKDARIAALEQEVAELRSMRDDVSALKAAMADLAASKTSVARELH